MKKIFLLLALTLSIFSCSSDDDATVTPTKAELLVGTWKLKSQKENGVEQTLTECELKSTSIFNGSSLTANSYVVKSKSEGGETCELSDLTAPYTITDNIVSITTTEGITTIEILNLTNNLLELKSVKPNSKALKEDVVIETYTK